MAVGVVDWFLVVLPDGSFLADGGMALVFTDRSLATWVAEQHHGKLRRAVRADRASYAQMRRSGQYDGSPDPAPVRPPHDRG